MSFLCTPNLSLHSHPQFLYPNPNPKSPKFLLQFPAKPPILRFSSHRTISFRSPARPTTSRQHPFTWLQIAATSAVLFFGLNVQGCLAASSPSLPANTVVAAQEESTVEQGGGFLVFTVTKFSGLVFVSFLNKSIAAPFDDDDDDEYTDDDGGAERNVDDVQMNEDNGLNAAEFENWKLKTFALSVPLRIVALRGSVPPSWIKVPKFI